MNFGLELLARVNHDGKELNQLMLRVGYLSQYEGGLFDNRGNPIWDTWYTWTTWAKWATWDICTIWEPSHMDQMGPIGHIGHMGHMGHMGHET